MNDIHELLQFIESITTSIFLACVSTYKISCVGLSHQSECMCHFPTIFSDLPRQFLSWNRSRELGDRAMILCLPWKLTSVRQKMMKRGLNQKRIIIYLSKCKIKQKIKQDSVNTYRLELSETNLQFYSHCGINVINSNT